MMGMVNVEVKATASLGPWVYELAYTCICRSIAGVVLLAMASSSHAQFDMAYGIYLQGDTAYVARYDRGLDVYDVREPEHVDRMGHLAWGGSSSSTGSITGWGSTVIVTTSDDLRIVDVSDSANPTLLGVCPGRFADVVRVADHLVCGSASVIGGTGIHVVSVADPSHPASTGGSGSGTILGIAAEGQTAYAAAYDGGLAVYDIADLAAPAFVGNCTSYASETPAALDVAVAGSFAFLTDGAVPGLLVFDISDRTNPTLVTTYHSSLRYDSVRYVKVDGDHAVLLGGSGGMELVDISDPAAIVPLGLYRPGTYYDAAMVSDRIYLASYDGLVILDVSDPSRLVKLGPYQNVPGPWTRIPDLPANVSGVAISSLADDQFIVADTGWLSPALWEVDLVATGATYRQLPFDARLITGGYNSWTPRFTSLVTVSIGGVKRVLAGSHNTVSFVDRDGFETGNVLVPVFYWSWDQSTLCRVDGSRVGFSIANFGSLSGANGLDASTGEHVCFTNDGTLALTSVRSGVQIYTSKETGECVAVWDMRGVGWTSDRQILLGSAERSADAGVTWTTYRDRAGAQLQFNGYGYIDEYGGRLVGQSGGKVSVGSLDGAMDGLDAPAGISWVRIDHSHGRVFAGAMDAIYFAPVTALVARQPALAFDPALSSPQAFGTAQELAVTGGSGTGAVRFEVVSGPGMIEGGNLLRTTSGTGTVLVRATKAGDEVYLATSVEASVRAAKASQAITFAAIPDQAATATVNLEATANSGLAVSYEVTGSAVLDGTTLLFTGTGAVTVRATQAGDGDYLPADPVPRTFVVISAPQAPLAFDPAPASPQVYNTIQALAISGGSGTGTVMFAVLSGPGEVVSGNQLRITSGTGTVTVRATKVGDALYAAASADAQVEAAKAPLTIAADSRSKTYGESAVFVGTEFTTTGLLNADTVTAVTLTSPGASAEATVAGSPYAVTPGNAVGTGLGNYAIAYVIGAMTVDPATLTVSADAKNRPYSQANPALTWTPSGFANGDTAAVLTGSPVLVCAALPDSPVAGSPYGVVITQGTLVAANYAFAFHNGSLTVGRATPTITWLPPANIEYGTPLSGTELNAMANTAGTFAYTPLAGTVLEQGTHTLAAAFAPDDSWNWGSITVEKPVAINDTTAPVVTGLSDDTGPTQAKNWTWSGTDVDITLQYRYTIDQAPGGAPGGAYAGVTTASKAAADGTWYLHVQARDRAGNQSAVRTVSVLLDNTAPQPASVSGVTPVHLSLPTWTWTSGGGDGNGQFRYQLDGAAGPWSETAALSFTSASTLGDGSHTLYVQERDLAGNWSASGHFTTVVDAVCAVAFAAGAHGSITGDAAQTLPYGGSATPVEAVGEYGYVFSGSWSNGSTTNPLTLTNVQSDTTVTASFRAAGRGDPDGQFLAVVDAAGVASGKGCWNLTGSYSTTVRSNPLALDLTHGSMGKLTGTATCTVGKGPAVTMPIKGSARGTRGGIALEATLKGANPASTVSVSLTLTLTVDTGRRQLTGRITGSIKANGTTTRVDDPVILNIPGAMDGTWTLCFQLDQAGKAVTGSAVLTLSNLVKHTFAVRGKTGANNTAVLSLAGDPPDPASKAITIRTTITPLEGGWTRPESFSGRIYGDMLVW